MPCPSCPPSAPRRTESRAPADLSGAVRTASRGVRTRHQYSRRTLFHCAAAALAQFPWRGFTDSTVNLYVATSASIFIAPADPNHRSLALTVRRSDVTSVVTLPSSFRTRTLPLSTSSRSALPFTSTRRPTYPFNPLVVLKR